MSDTRMFPTITLGTRVILPFGHAFGLLGQSEIRVE